MKKATLAIFTFLLLGTFFTGCDPEDPDIEKPEEVITTLRYILSPVNGSGDVTLSFQDLDGDGANAPVIVGGSLDTNTTYTGTLELANDSETPSEDIGAEVLEEGTDHQFFFSSSLSDLTVSYDDTDEDGKPIGLSTNLTTGAAGTGTLTVILKHEPVKDATGVESGDITNADGETDIEVTFNITVQ
jgi:hypothetical protein